MKRILLLFFVLTTLVVNAQLVVDNTTQTPQQLVQNVVVGQGINVSNITFNGSAANANSISDQVGAFSNGTTTNIGIDKGIILSTGRGILAKGPNNNAAASLATSNPSPKVGDNDLSLLTTGAIKNVSILEFDFVPVGNTLNFNFVFASEEYPEFVNDIYNDNFGFFLSGPGISGPFSGNAKNIALIPTSTLPVTINNLNNGLSNTGPCEFCQYYVNNENGTTIQYDGFTKVLGATANVQCGKTYHIKLAIANVGDNNYDSAVFIEGASFSSSGINLGNDFQSCSATDYTLKTGLPATLVHEWRLDGAIISGNGPDLLVDQSGTYSVTAFPFGATCPVRDEIKVAFDTTTKPVLTCGTKTANSIQFDWNLLTGATDYSVSYQVNSTTPVSVGTIGNKTFYTVNALNAGDSVTLTVTPIGSTENCFASETQICSLTNCVPPTLSLTSGSASQNVCIGEAISDMVYNIGGGATTAAIALGKLPNGVTLQVLGNQFTIKGSPTESGTFSFVIETVDGCLPNATLNGSITVQSKTTPAFDSIAPVCEGTVLLPLPTKSLDNFNGVWSPALNNLATTEYTFAPDAGQCANATKLTIGVNLKTTPAFDSVAPICEGTVLVPLPTKSLENINGVWTPPLNNLANTEYTFTPDAGQCANATKLTIDVNLKTMPTFTAIAPICPGTILNPLPIKSLENINGVWSPPLNNLATTEYTFAPDTGQCATTTKLTIAINSSAVTPTFDPIAPFCPGTILNPLPIKSLENINGVWSPPLNNLATTEYTFAPDAGQCSNIYKLNIVVNPIPKPELTGGTICINRKTNAIINSTILNAQLSTAANSFEWFLDGKKIDTAIQNTFEAKKGGEYAVVATNKTTGCVSESVSAIVKENYADPIIEITKTEDFSDTSTILVNVYGIDDYLYQLDKNSFQSSNVFTGVSSGKHTVTVKDKIGCVNFSQQISILSYPKFFTPNGDGSNETWNISGFDKLSNPLIYIFDRYGKLIKQLNAFQNGWDGTYNGRDLPSSDYWFKVIYLENTISKEFKSHFSLKR